VLFFVLAFFPSTQRSREREKEQRKKRVVVVVVVRFLVQGGQKKRKFLVFSPFLAFLSSVV